MRLTGRSAVVIGGGGAARLAQEGAHVILVGSAMATGMAARISDEGGSAEAFVADPNDWEELSKVARQCEELGREIDTLVTAYGGMEWKTLEESDIETFAELVRVNAVGPVMATKAFLPFLKRAGRGAIVHMGSIDGLYGNPRVPAYSVGKAGLVPLTHVMASDFARYDIRVNAIVSGLTDQVDPEAFSAMVAGGGDFPTAGYIQQIMDATPLKRYGTMGEATAGPLAFLVSDDADYITGQVLIVDCGRIGTTPGTVWPHAPTPPALSST